MPEQHVQLMKGLGISDDEIKAIEALTPDQMKAWAEKPTDPESLKIFDPSKYVGNVQTGIKTKLSNDPEFLKTIPEDKIDPAILKKYESGQYARFQNELVEVATKKLGLEDKDLTADDRKSIKVLAEKIAVSYLSKNTKDGSLKEMQTQLQTALQSVETMKTEHTTNLTKALEETNGKHTAKLIKTLTKVELASIDGITLSVGASFISDPVLSALTAKYAVVLDDNDNLVLKQKENPKLDVIDTAGKTVTFQQALKETVVANKLGVVKAADDKDKDKDKDKRNKIIIGGGDGGGGEIDLVPSYIADKISKAPVDKE